MIKATVNDHNTFVIESKAGELWLDGSPVKWNQVQTDPNSFHVLQGHRSYSISIISADTVSKTFKLKVNNKICRVTLKDRFDELLHELGMDALASGKVDDIKAPMPGLVVDIRVENGQRIKKGDAVVVLEAMKMENILKATADALVKSVQVKKGSKVEKNEILVTLQ